jgi:hypothetical protein
MTSLLSLRRDPFNPKQIRIADLIPRHSMGAPNGLYDLQNYVVGVSPAGLVLSSETSLLDLQRSFRHINYFSALARIRVRNNIQRGVGPAPVDFIAVPLAPESVSVVLAALGLAPGGDSLMQAILLYAADDFEALVLTRRGSSGMELRYLPIQKIKSGEDGSIQFSVARWRAGFPLNLWEDPNLHAPQQDHDDWVNTWHPERDWMGAIHQTRYSNGLVGITEQFVESPRVGPWFQEAPPNDQRLLQRLETRRRRLVAPDMLVFASDHWNFNVRNFNPGGNHGSFLRISTHSVLMFAGGEQTRLPRGVQVDEPYDSLSFAPTILRLVGREDAERAALPGPLIDALFRP